MSDYRNMSYPPLGPPLTGWRRVVAALSVIVTVMLCLGLVSVMLATKDLDFTKRGRPGAEQIRGLPP